MSEEVVHPAIIGVDPGVPLYCSLVSKDKALVAATYPPMVASLVEQNKGGKKKKVWENDGAKIANLFAKWKSRVGPCAIVCESAHPRPSDGIVSAAKYVGSFWLVKGIAAGLGIPFFDVSPVKWKRGLSLPPTENKKGVSLEMARELWPGKAGLHFAQKQDHNTAEASLIAYWGVQNIKL